MSRTDEHSINDFLIGLLLGLVTGASLSLLLTPRSGQQTRQLVRDLPSNLQEDWRNPNGRTRSFVDKRQAQLERSMDSVRHKASARRLAKAKQLEESANGPDNGYFH